MPIEIPSAIRLREAFFCLSCEAVTNCSDFCPECGQGQLWPLESWLGRVYGPEDSQHQQSILQEVGPASTGKISQRSSKRNYWKIVRNYTRKPLLPGEQVFSVKQRGDRKPCIRVLKTNKFD